MKNRSEKMLSTSQVNLIVLDGLRGAAFHVIERLGNYSEQLISIYDNNDRVVKKKCFSNLKKIQKLNEIADELVRAIEAFSLKVKRGTSLVADRSNQQKAIEEFSDEMSVLNEMVYNVGKSVFSLTHQIETPEYSLHRTMAA